MFWGGQTGLPVRIAGPVPGPDDAAEPHFSEEAALTADEGDDLRVTVLAEEGSLVEQGAPVLSLRHQPEIVFTAPMAGRIAEVKLAPGRRLSEMRFFREDGAGRHAFDTAAAQSSDTDLRTLLQSSGMWRAFRSRPFGRLPATGETPAAIFVMGLDTGPGAPDPRRAVAGREEQLARGMRELLRLSGGPVHLCTARGSAPLPGIDPHERLRTVEVAPVHPWGLAGFLIHRHFPAGPERPVWDIHLEDVADIGGLLATRLVAETRLVSVSGPACTEARLARCQPGADLRSLSYGRVVPGPHVICSGSALEGRRARWLGARDRQVTVLHATPGPSKRNWFGAALTRAARPTPLIPTAALEHAFGGALPASLLLRALAAGDRETAVNLGALSLVAEDLALADYVTGAEPRFSALHSALLDDIAIEEAAA